MRLDVLIGVISCLGDFVQVAAKNSTRQTLLNDLLANYDSSIAPDYERDTPTRVFVQVHIQNIYAVSASYMDYQVDMMFRQKWVDERLNFTHHGKAIERLELDIKAMDNIWTANTYFANEKTASVHDVTMPNKMIHIYPNGTVVYSIRLSMTLSCAMDLTKYPMDEQLCPIIIESYGYTVDNIVFEWDPVSPVKLMTDIEVPQFDAIMHGKYDKCEKTYGDGVSAGQFACLETNVRFTRKMGYYIVQVFLPSILIVVLSWLSFWVDLDAVPARISLGVLTVLTMTTQSAGSREALPHVSYIKAIDIWMAACLMFVFLALMEFAYAHAIARRERKLRTTEERNEETDEKAETSQTQMDKCRLLIEARWLDKTSRVAFPTAFAIFNLIFWLYYLLSPDPE